MFQLVDCFFFISLGITFLLLFLMAFHFKTRISSLEKKNDALADMCSTIVSKISQVKQMVVAQNTMPPVMQNIPNIFFRSPNEDRPSSTIEIIEISDSDSDSDSESDSEEEDELVVDELVLAEMEKVEEEEEVEVVEVEKVEVVEEVEVEVVEVEVEADKEEPEHLEEEKVLDTDVQSEVFSLAINHDDKNSFKKMNVQMLRTLVISKGLCTDPSKMKKLELLKMLGDSSEIDIVEK